MPSELHVVEEKKDAYDLEEEHVRLSPIIRIKNERKELRKIDSTVVNDSRSSKFWRFGKKIFPSSEIRYLCSIILIYLVIISSLINLSIGTDIREIWLTLLSACIGVVTPSPDILINGKR